MVSRKVVSLTQPLRQLWQRIQRVDPERARAFNTLLLYVTCVYVTHALLRLMLLFRVDPFGNPFVGRTDWYVFHALAIDVLWVLPYSAPFLALCLLLPSRAGIWSAGCVSLHSILLLLTVVDYETMRFMGMHVDPSFLGTYGNAAAVRESWTILASDRSIPYLPLFLLVLVAPASLLLWLKLRRRWVWPTAERLLGPVVATTTLSLVASWMFVHVIWTGGFRLLKLQPVVDTLWTSASREGRTDISEADFAEASHLYQAEWTRVQGDDSYVFPDGRYLYYHVPLFVACKSQLPALAERCAQDRDGDKFPAASDCDDSDASAFPGAVEVAGDGVDQDCSGLDDDPWNFVILMLESHRGVNVGHLQFAMGLEGRAPASMPTPFLDQLAVGGHAWSNFQVAGIPTINALLGVHLSLLQHPERFISTDFLTLSNQTFVSILRNKGYQTHYFSAGDPTWDGQTPWFRQWYDGISYDRQRELDGLMLEDMASWMKTNVKRDRPFLLTAMTKTNHFPFRDAAELEPRRPNDTLAERMESTMAYTDARIRDFVDSLRDEPWFDHTVFVVFADHGFPMNEHGSSAIGYGLYPESTWIPFVVAGAHPKLGLPRRHDEPASQLDVGPTLLDLAGVEVPNAFMGHSLLRPNKDNATTWLFRGQEMAFEDGSLRLHRPRKGIVANRETELFDVQPDRMERSSCLAQHADFASRWGQFLDKLDPLHSYLIENDLVWPEDNPKLGLGLR